MIVGQKVVRVGGVAPVGWVTGFARDEQTFECSDGQRDLPVGTDLFTAEQLVAAVAAEREQVEREMGSFVETIMDAYPTWTMSQLVDALKKTKDHSECCEMTQTEQNSAVRTRDEQVNLILTISEDLALNQEAPTTQFMLGQIEEAEARGAAEQRRKDAEGVYQTLNEDGEWSAISKDEYLQAPYEGRRIIPANVAAMEARIAELEEAEQLARADAEASKARVKVLEEALTRIADSDPFCGSQTLRHTARAALTREGGV